MIRRNTTDDALPTHAGPPRRLSGPLEFVVIIISALLLALLIQGFVVKPYRIPSRSMVPTLAVHQRILVNRIVGRFGSPSRGDVAVFTPPAGADIQLPSAQCGVRDGEPYLPGRVFTSHDRQPMNNMPCAKPTPGKATQSFVKRVIGMPGDRLKIIKGHAWINGKRLNEPYINSNNSCDDLPSQDPNCTFGREIVIPKGHYFMMGDNRNESDDSRYWGPIPKKNVIGEAFATYWPPSKIGGIG